MYELLIKNGYIMDGTGEAPYLADIGLRAGKIACIGKGLSGGKQVIDAGGLAVTPGFIDAHSHSDNRVLSYPDQKEKLEQGITTSVGGQCGSSPAPVDPSAAGFPVEGFGMSTDVYRTMGTFLDTLRTQPLGANLAVLVGHNALRRTVMGMENRAPTRAELEKMADYLREGISRGARGLSFGLTYTPGSFAGTEELSYLATVAAQCGGVVSAHIRDEGFRLTEACEEFLHVIRQSGARGVVSHHKAIFRENWGKVNTTLDMIDKANAGGCDVYMDTYPYTASSTSLYARFIPPAFCDGGTEALLRRLKEPAVRQKLREAGIRRFGEEESFDWVVISCCPKLPQYVGMPLNEIAKERGQDPYDVIFDLIVENENNCTASFFLMCEEDLEKVLSHPRCMICTDSGVETGRAFYHPRLRSAFPRALGRYARERGTVTVQEMVRKMTGLPAQVYGLEGKGLLKEGFDGDLCVFDPQKIRDAGDHTNCRLAPEGLRYVLVGGQVVAENAVYNGNRNARFL